MRNRLHLLCTVFIAVVVLITSCEYDPDGTNFRELEKQPDQIRIAINLANTNPDDIIYTFGPTSFYYQINPEKGQVVSVRYYYNMSNPSTEYDNSRGYISYYPESQDEGRIKDLNLDIKVKINNGSLAEAVTGHSYFTTVTYKIKYVKIEASDFAVKKAEIDKFTIAMVNKKDAPFKLVIDGKIVKDIDNIEIPRNSFPNAKIVTIRILPVNADLNDVNVYPFVDFIARDKILENAEGYDYRFSIDSKNKSLFAYSYGNTYVYDANMNFLNKANVDPQTMAITQKTGLIACYDYSRITTYSNGYFQNVVSTIDNAFHNFTVNENDQLFWINNFQVDAFDLRTGNQLYTLDYLPQLVYNLAASSDGKYLYVETDEQAIVYQLNNNSATILFKLERSNTNSYFHPVNKHHLIRSRYSDGFEVLDIDTRKIVYSNRGEYQNVDPITGNIIFYDKDYSFAPNKSINIIIDKSYNEIYRFDNDTKSLYGAFVLFNNYLIKSVSYVDLSSKLTK